MPVKILAITIFVIIYALLISDKFHRTVIALWGALLFAGFPILTAEGLKFGLLTSGDLLRYENWEALGLIFGLFTLVAALRESGFFRWLGLSVLNIARFNPLYVFVMFSATAAVLSAFMDSVTVLMFLATLTLETCLVLKMNPLPFIIAAITSANIGGTATIIGNPPNIIIGTGLHLSFMSFVVNMVPFVLASFLINLSILFFFNRNIFLNNKQIAAEVYEKQKGIDPFSVITDPKLFKIGLAVFAVVILLLIFHGALGISVAFAGIVGASLILLLGGEKMPDVLERIDWHTLIFFACLFIMVGGLEKTGVLTDIAKWMGVISGGNVIVALIMVLWFSAVLSAIVDNVPFAAAMVPIVKNLSQATAIPISTLAWAMVLGVNIGGNATPIGASANVIGISVAEKRLGKKISWLEYCKFAIPATLISLLILSVLVYLRYLL